MTSQELGTEQLQLMQLMQSRPAARQMHRAVLHD